MKENKLDEVFRQLKQQNKKAMIAYLAAGYPRFEKETRLIKILIQSGVNVLELGIPFSDPIADGPTIQFASQKALEQGVTLKKILAWVKKNNFGEAIPVVFMSYLNPLLSFGLEKFARAASAAGLSGLIVPDMIPEEGRDLELTLAKKNIHLIYLLAPTTPRPRQKMIAQRTKGFLYAVSVAGVTGARKKYSSQTQKWLQSLKSISRSPVCVGFGISGARQIRELKSSVDGFIVGSALIDKIRSSTGATAPMNVKKFIVPLVKECSNGR